MKLELLGHSHPGVGIEAIHPSPTDPATMKCWERHAPFVGAIFSADGRYVRFFNANPKSLIHLYTATTSPNSPPGFTNYPLVKTFTIPNRLDPELTSELTDRQGQLAWWNQERINRARISQFGAGGLGGAIEKRLIGMGAGERAGRLRHGRGLEPERATLPGDLGEPSPHALLDNISPYATGAMTWRGFWTQGRGLRFETAIRAALGDLFGRRR